MVRTLISSVTFQNDIENRAAHLRLHVYLSKAHPGDRRYSARIKTSNVHNTWAPVNPIVQGTCCAD